MKKVIFTGGGTGGHVYPALAVIESLLEKEPGLTIVWIGQHKGVERTIIMNEGFQYRGIFSGKFRRYFSFQNFIDLFKIGLGFFESLIILIREKPQVVFGKGGFVTVPVLWAAFLLRIPVLVHESDVSSGLANRLVSGVADKIFVAYEETINTFTKRVRKKINISGNPIRKQFFKSDPLYASKKYGLKKDQDFLLVLGGSSGAEQVNKLVEGILSSLPENCFVLHQMGSKLYRKSERENYVTVPFISENLPDLIASSSLVISRSGAGSVWELSMLGAVAIYIPLGHRGDQVMNARIFEKHGACLSLSGENATIENLKTVVLTLLKDKMRCKEMSTIAQTRVRRDASEYLANEILGILT